MTPLREAAQLALKALEGGVDSWRLIGPAIDALKAALEQYDKDRVWIEERKASWAKDRELVRANAAEESARIAKAAEEGKCWACGVLKQPERHVSYVCPQCHWSLEQPEQEQEPVACPHRDEPRGCYRVRCQLGRKCVEPLYTHPPRREWKDGKK
jgi:hypothetical protein